jgi:radical SAM protein with 4Fe4S-binding SPASM domain
VRALPPTTACAASTATFAATLGAIACLRRHRITVQVNTVVLRENVDELPAVARIVRATGAAIWEVFFLVKVGRGTALPELTPDENEDVCHFLVDASRYGFVVRTVEAPFFRRVVVERAGGHAAPTSALYRRLAEGLRAELGPAGERSRAQTKGTRDGRGILFVAHDGDVTPSGFLPLRLGNVRDDDVVELYREHPLLRRIRKAEFAGRCGRCAYRELCGGSRARAYADSGDPLGEDRACAFQPAA